MNDYRKRRLLSRSRFKQQVLRRYLASFVVTAVVASVAIVIGLRAPTAIFQEVSAFGSDLFYRVTIEDPDAQIQQDSLKIVAENQLESHYVFLTSGENSGSFTSLTPDTTYFLRIVADRGFGPETLAKTQADTTSGYGGRILSHQPLSDTSNGMEQHMMSYQITTAYNDTFGELLSVTLKYAYLFDYELETISYPSAAAFIATDIDAPLQTSIIGPIPNQYVTLFLLLEAELKSGGFVTLDAVQFKTPIVFHASLYVENASSDSLDVVFYPDYESVLGTTYVIYLKNSLGDIVDQTIIDAQISSSDEPISIHYGDLDVSTAYQLELEVTYIDPLTNVSTTQIYRTIPVMTTPIVSFQVNVNELLDQYEIHISAFAPPGFFSNPSVAVYEVLNGDELYQYAIWFDFTTDQSGILYATILIDKPAYPNFRFKVYVNQNVSAQVTYYQCVMFAFEGVQ